MCEPGAVGARTARVSIANGDVQKPRYVDADLCTGCRECEYACPDLRAGPRAGRLHRAQGDLRVPFSNAVPQLAVMDPRTAGSAARRAASAWKICPTGAINYFEKPKRVHHQGPFGGLATGYETHPRLFRKSLRQDRRQPFAQPHHLAADGAPAGAARPLHARAPPRPTARSPNRSPSSSAPDRAT